MFLNTKFNNLVFKNEGINIKVKFEFGREMFLSFNSFTTIVNSFQENHYHTFRHKMYGSSYR